MKKNQKTLTADSKLQAAIDFMKKTYSSTEYTEWKSKDITNRYRIGGSFPSALKALGAIKTEYGTVMLTDRINTLRPSTVRKKMNKMVAECLERNKNVIRTPKVKTQTAKQTDYDQVIIALKQQIRNEVRDEIVSELLSRLIK